MTKYPVWGDYDEEYSYCVSTKRIDDAPYTIELADEEFAAYQKAQTEWEAWQERIKKERVWQEPKPRPVVKIIYPYQNTECYAVPCTADEDAEMYEVGGQRYCSEHADLVVNLKAKAAADGNRREWWAYEHE